MNTEARRVWIAVLLAAGAPTLAALAYVHGAQGKVAQILYFSSKALIFCFPLIWWLLYEKCRPRPSQTPRLTRKRDLLLGFASGLIITLAMGAAYYGFLSGRIDVQRLTAEVRELGAYEHYVVFAVFLSVVNSGLEEYYWRWFVFGRSRSLMPLPAAVVFSSLAFAAHHYVVLQAFLGSAALAALLCAGIACGGVLWSWHFQRSGRLSGIWLSHFCADVTALAVGYVLLF